MTTREVYVPAGNTLPVTKRNGSLHITEGQERKATLQDGLWRAVVCYIIAHQEL